MSDMEPRLIRCFHATFPRLEESAIPNAHRDQIKDWDSLASVTLIRLIEEEFGVAIDLFDLEDLNSFSEVRQYLQTHAA